MKTAVANSLELISVSYLSRIEDLTRKEKETIFVLLN